MLNRLRRWKIGARLQIATAVTIVAFLALQVAVQMVASQRLWDARATLLQSVDQTAIGIVAAYQHEESAGHMSRETARPPNRSARWSG